MTPSGSTTMTQKNSVLTFRIRLFRGSTMMTQNGSYPILLHDKKNLLRPQRGRIFWCIISCIQCSPRLRSESTTSLGEHDFARRVRLRSESTTSLGEHLQSQSLASLGEHDFAWRALLLPKAIRYIKVHCSIFNSFFSIFIFEIIVHFQHIQSAIFNPSQ